MTNVVVSIEQAAASLGKTIETDAILAWREFSGVVVADAEAIWADFKPLILAVEPRLYADLKTVIVGVLTAIGKGASLPVVKDTLMSLLAAGETDLLAAVKAMDQNLLQIIIAVAIKSIP